MDRLMTEEERAEFAERVIGRARREMLWTKSEYEYIRRLLCGDLGLDVTRRYTIMSLTESALYYVLCSVGFLDRDNPKHDENMFVTEDTYFNTALWAVVSNEDAHNAWKAAILLSGQIPPYRLSGELITPGGI